MKRLAVSLGLRDKIEKTFNGMLDDFLSKFKSKQTIFKGYRHTFVANDGYVDQPEKRKFQNVQSTVDEQFAWFKEHTQDYFSTVFSIEKTNSMGVTGALVVDGENWGEYSTLELLRLKSVLDGKLKAMIGEIPVRVDTTIWKPTEDSDFSGRGVWQSPLDAGKTKTTIKRSYILNDPHPDAKRQPILGEESTQVETGAYTLQDFSGEWSMRDRAKTLVKYDKLYKAVISALEEANSAELQESDLGTKALNYIL